LYGKSKAISEQMLRAAHDTGGIWTIVRPTSLWGPWFGVPYKGFFEAIERGRYVHPGELKVTKQWGYVGNTVHQIDRLVDAPPEQVHRRTFYLADYEPIELRRFADQVQASLDARPIRSMPIWLLRAAARAGDVGQKMGWRHPPMTSFRYRNIVTPEIQDLEPLRKVVGPLPYTADQGIAITIQWLRRSREPRAPNRRDR
jgi:nucleoside-diphosphate-sugar epimerase